MPVAKITALDTFTHGRLDMARGDIETIEAGEAEELRKAGLVSVEAAADAQSDEDLIGAKMDVEVKNKMAPAPSNKTAKANK